jgi:hypothetical protein
VRASRCVICGNEAIITDRYDTIEEHEGEPRISNIIVEHIDGTSYTFDTAECAVMFKRFSSVYGNNFADE